MVPYCNASSRVPAVAGQPRRRGYLRRRPVVDDEATTGDLIARHGLRFRSVTAPTSSPSRTRSAPSSTRPALPAVRPVSCSTTAAGSSSSVYSSGAIGRLVRRTSAGCRLPREHTQAELGADGMAIPIPDDVGRLLQAPNYDHFPTQRRGPPETGSSGQDSRSPASSHCQSVRSAQVPGCQAGYAWRKRWRRLGSGPQARHLGPLGRPPSGGAGPAAFTLFVGMGGRSPPPPSALTTVLPPR